MHFYYHCYSSYYEAPREHLKVNFDNSFFFGVRTITCLYSDSIRNNLNKDWSTQTSIASDHCLCNDCFFSDLWWCENICSSIHMYIRNSNLSCDPVHLNSTIKSFACKESDWCMHSHSPQVQHSVFLRLLGNFFLSLFSTYERWHLKVFRFFTTVHFYPTNFSSLRFLETIKTIHK